ncbi:MAG: histidinol-phosphatase [Planctomycetes bacterium]|nr:histidinol-phosphatase [Planctomycetota bacterium]
MKTDLPSPQSLLDFAVEAAQLAGAVTLGYFNAQTPVEWKQDRSPVTAADRSAEEKLRERIERAFPGHGIVGEEHGERPGDGRVRWILDPIDGTFSFIHGVPLYSVLVGLEIDGEVQVGVIHLPALGETVYAARGLGCWWNGRRARVSATAELPGATVLTGGGKMFEKTGRWPHFERLIKTCGVHRSWCDGYGYSLVATGRADIAVDPIMKIWDVAALVPVVLEAGGRITDWKGRCTHQAGEIVATNGQVHDAVLKTLA